VNKVIYLYRKEKCCILILALVDRKTPEKLAILQAINGFKVAEFVKAKQI
jgi:hypothetical protein